MLAAERWFSRWVTPRSTPSVQEGGRAAKAAPQAPEADRRDSESSAEQPPARRVVAALPATWRPSTVLEEEAGMGFVPVLTPARPVVLAQAEHEDELATDVVAFTPAGEERHVPAALAPGAGGAAWDEVAYGLDRGVGLLVDDDDDPNMDVSAPDEQDHWEEVDHGFADGWQDDGADRWKDEEDLR